MNAVTRQIMDTMRCSADDAMTVQDWMSVDFSECTNRELDDDIRATHFYLRETGRLSVPAMTNDELASASDRELGL